MGNFWLTALLVIVVAGYGRSLYMLKLERKRVKLMKDKFNQLQDLVWEDGVFRDQAGKTEQPYNSHDVLIKWDEFHKIVNEFNSVSKLDT